MPTSFARGGWYWLAMNNYTVDLIRSDGAVLNGEVSLDEALAVAVRVALGPGETYENVGEYDPVLRSHCRLDRQG